MENDISQSPLTRTNEVAQTISRSLMRLEKVNPAIDAVFKGTSPEVFGNEKPISYIGRTYIEYMKIIKDLATLSGKDLELMEKADLLCEKRGITENSNAEGGVANLLINLGPEKRQRLLKTIMESSNPNSPLFEKALDDLTSRMEMGTRLANKGEDLTDGASDDADIAIWGHEKGLGIKAMINQVMLHFICRTFTAGFIDDNNPKVQDMAKIKDTLISAMGNVIYLRTAQGKMKPEISGMWATSRKNGGLEWNTNAKQEAFNEVVSADRQQHTQ